MGLWTEDISVYYHDERLPLCGNMQFMKEFGAEGYSVEYQEGTVDRRKVGWCAVQLGLYLMCYVLHVLCVLWSRSRRGVFLCGRALLFRDGGFRTFTAAVCSQPATDVKSQ